MRKSRLWTAFSAVVGLATLVVLASCQGPIGPAGKDGAGAPGAPGPAGGPGATNEGPTALKAIPTQYLVAGVEGKGTAPAATAKATAAAAAGNYKSVEIDLNDYFRDAKTPALSYEAVSSDIKIVSLSTTATPASATTPAGGNDLVADGKLTVTAAGVVPATAKTATAIITVSAFDGTNEAETATFSVVVVKSNAPPTAIVVVPIADLVDKIAVAAEAGVTVAMPVVKNKLYKAAGTITLEFKATITPGPSSKATADLEPLTYRAFVGTEKVVSVTHPVSTGVANTYSVDIKALKSPKKLNAAKVVKLFAMDSFGAETEITSFMVTVNTPPTKLHDLPDVDLYRGGGTIMDARAWRLNSSFQQVFYELNDYFKDLELKSIMDVGGVMDVKQNVEDTTCTFSTSPGQPTGRPATVRAVPPVTPVITKDAVTATTLASVTNGDAPADLGTRTLLIDDADRTNKVTARVEVNSAAMQEQVNEDPPYSAQVDAVLAAGVGVFTLTIMCEDPDGTAMSSARIRVSNGTN